MRSIFSTESVKPIYFYATFYMWETKTNNVIKDLWKYTYSGNIRIFLKINIFAKQEAQCTFWREYKLWRGYHKPERAEGQNVTLMSLCICFEK